MSQHEEQDRRSKSSHFGTLLKEKREALGLNKTTLARELSISLTYLTRLERGDSANPSPGLLIRMTHALNVPLADLCAMTGCTLPSELPGYEAYLRATHADWSEVAIQELVDFHDFVEQRQQAG